MYSFEADNLSKVDENVTIGSLSAVTNRSMPMDAILPDWLEHGVESTLRDTEEPAAPAGLPAPVALSSAQQFVKGTAPPIVLTPGGGSSPVGSQLKNGGSKGAWLDLDKFYDEADKEEVEEGDDESEGESEEEGEEVEEGEPDNAKLDDSDDDDGEEEGDDDDSSEEAHENASLLAHSLHPS